MPLLVSAHSSPYESESGFYKTYLDPRIQIRITDLNYAADRIRNERYLYRYKVIPMHCNVCTVFKKCAKAIKEKNKLLSDFHSYIFPKSKNFVFKNKGLRMGTTFWVIRGCIKASKLIRGPSSVL